MSPKPASGVDTSPSGGGAPGTLVDSDEYVIQFPVALVAFVADRSGLVLDNDWSRPPGSNTRLVHGGPDRRHPDPRLVVEGFLVYQQKVTMVTGRFRRQTFVFLGVRLRPSSPTQRSLSGRSVRSLSDSSAGRRPPAIVAADASPPDARRGSRRWETRGLQLRATSPLLDASQRRWRPSRRPYHWQFRSGRSRHGNTDGTELEAGEQCFKLPNEVYDVVKV